MLAHLSRDPALRAAFVPGAGDVFAALARRWRAGSGGGGGGGTRGGAPAPAADAPAITPQEREAAKKLTYGLL
jgi:hypothetical protein